MSPLSDDHRRHAEDAAPWVLGALDDREADAFAAHLEHCVLCQEDVRRLQATADLLPGSPPPVGPPPGLKARLMEQVEAEAALVAAAEGREPAAVAAPARRRRRWAGRPAWLAVPAAAVLVAVGVVGGVVVVGGDPEPVVVQASTAPALGGSAKVRLERHADGARLIATGLPDPSAGRVYQVWLERRDGSIAPTEALFTPRAGGASTVAVPGGEADDVTRVLVTREAAGGAGTPSEQPVIAVRTA